MKDAIDLSSVKRIHFTGIKGVAMAALAIIARERGMIVTGSDTEEHFPSDRSLEAAGISIMKDFLPEHVGGKDIDLLVYTGAHGGRKNPEVQAAIQSGIHTLPHGKALGLFMKGNRQISVAGCHGKSTTTAMIATIFAQDGGDPSYAVGCGNICPLGAPGHWGKDRWFIAEADEYAVEPGFDNTPRFYWQEPDIAAVTNIGYDHPDIYPSIDAIVKALSVLLSNRTKDGIAVLNGDDERMTSLAGERTVLVGMGPANDYRICDVGLGDGNSVFRLVSSGADREFVLGVGGIHNVRNAALAAAVAIQSGIDIDRVAAGLRQYCGIMRRFEILGTTGGIRYVDDYAHHPDEIKAAIAAAKAGREGKVIAVFQPHTYSRTKSLFGGFSEAFDMADSVIITDVYASAREDRDPTVSGSGLAESIRTRTNNASYAASWAAADELIRSEAARGDTVLFMGAGDIYEHARAIVRARQEKEHI